MQKNEIMQYQRKQKKMQERHVDVIQETEVQ